ncbi:MAG: UDP-N-acetylmuramoyl-L-alanine--D-glutamate ligase [Gammaproteobacteria bacterium]|nr:UDP-N-acetylmuramoyl-L-alanine--D-glutamate ligase [Gammaproteobacteria bacterium]
MCAQQFEAKVTLIVGMGVTGMSCARYLQQQDVVLRIVDSREQPPMWADVRSQFADCELHAGAFTSKLLTNVNRILLSPGVALAEPLIQTAMQRGIEVIGDIELFARNVKKPVIAITGSNGKSTVTTLLGEMFEAAGLSVAVGGNLGIPALDLLGEKDPDVFILELSSFQLETTTSLKTAVSVVLNVSEDHMDRYPGLAAYAESKSRVYSRSRCCVINRDDVCVSSMPFDNKAQRIYFTKNAPSENEFGLRKVNSDTFLCYGSTKLIAADELKLIGQHNLLNALAALALTKGFGIEIEKTLPALKRFTGLAHRCQWVIEHNNVRWINDSKATNVGAAQVAIESMPGTVVLIAGGDGKDADFSPLRSSIKNKVRAVVLLGKDAARMQEVLHDITECHRVDDLQTAVIRANELAQAGDTVLLAPACASLDMFKNYMQRGELFTRYVQDLVGA